MNNKFYEIGISTENDLIEFVDSLNDEEEVKSDIYGYFSNRCAFSNSGTPAYVIMPKYHRVSHTLINVSILLNTKMQITNFAAHKYIFQVYCKVKDVVC